MASGELRGDPAFVAAAVAAAPGALPFAAEALRADRAIVAAAVEKVVTHQQRGGWDGRFRGGYCCWLGKQGRKRVLLAVGESVLDRVKDGDLLWSACGAARDDERVCRLAVRSNGFALGACGPKATAASSALLSLSHPPSLSLKGGCGAFG